MRAIWMRDRDRASDGADMPGRNQKSWIFGGKGASAPLKLIHFYENRKNGAETFRTAPNWPQLATIGHSFGHNGHNGHNWPQLATMATKPTHLPPTSTHSHLSPWHGQLPIASVRSNLQPSSLVHCRASDLLLPTATPSDAGQ